jgi:hypothetical protein
VCNEGSRFEIGEDYMTTFGANNNKSSFHYTIVVGLQTYLFDDYFSFWFELCFISVLTIDMSAISDLICFMLVNAFFKAIFVGLHLI